MILLTIIVCKYEKGKLIDADMQRQWASMPKLTLLYSLFRSSVLLISIINKELASGARLKNLLYNDKSQTYENLKYCNF